jgi:hypothetical protein
MTTTPADDRKQADGITESMKRRGLIAAAWAAVAAFVLKQTTQPVEAGVDGDVVLGSLNTPNSVTAIDNTNPNDIAFVARSVAGTNGTGLFGVGSGFGVFGENRASGRAGGAGVFGISDRSDSYGGAGQHLTGGAASSCDRRVMSSVTKKSGRIGPIARFGGTRRTAVLGFLAAFDRRSWLLRPSPGWSAKIPPSSVRTHSWGRVRR